MESYKQADTSETRRQLLSLVASKVTYAELVAHIPRLTRYEFTAPRRYTLEVGAGQGLDCYAAEGGRGFDDLLSLLNTLVKYGANEAVIAELKDNFRYLKQ